MTTSSSHSEDGGFSLSDDERSHFEYLIEGGYTSETVVDEGLRIREELRNVFDPQPPSPRRERKTKRLNTPTETRGDDEYMADEESLNGSDTELASSSEEEYKPLRDRTPGLADQLRNPIRYCIFNVGGITRKAFWDILKKRLSKEISCGVQRIEAITQPNGRRRMDLWISASVASRLKSATYLTATGRRVGTMTDFRLPLRELKTLWRPNSQTKTWRLDVYREWRDRKLEYTAPRVTRVEPPRKTIMTFNVNGLGSKRSEVIQMLHQRDVGIIALQETLCNVHKNNLEIPGYEVYQRSKTKNFRGQALAVHRSYTSYEVGSGSDEYMIHVKVVGLTEGAPWHVVSMYLPSGGNHRGTRTACVNKLLKLHQQIMTKEPKARLMLLGDFNMSRDILAKKLRVNKSGLVIAKVSGNGMTFHRRSSRWSDLDSIVLTPEAVPYLRQTKVLRAWGELKVDSDHFPLTTRLRAKTDIVQQETPVKARFDTDKIKGHGKTIVHSNRWALLPIEPITSTEELDEATQTFTNVINTEGLEGGIKAVVPDKVYTYDRNLKRRLKKVANARRRWYAAKKAGSRDATKLRLEYYTIRDDVRKQVALKELHLRSKKVARVTELYRDREMKAFHRWESQNTVKGSTFATDKVTPVKDKNGVLLTDKKDILQRTNEYYKELLQDDPKKLSRNGAYWSGKAKSRRENPLECNNPITWRDVLTAIRTMALGTSPGNDDIPIELYKSLLKEECHQHLRNQNVEVGDATYVALPVDKLPDTPCTPMGVQLERIIKGMWTNAAQPKCWSKVVNVSLHKSGDPTDLLNYRGISLISVGMKVFTVVLALRISKLAELNELFIREQGGFRTGEEAVAQFIALADIVRRRRLVNKKTWIVFIDFKKAFDKVMHEALFEKMEAMGFRGHFLEVIKAIYRTSSASTRVGGEYGEAYDMLRGTRQGCPLSPILFLLFINDFMTYMPRGVEVPCIMQGPKHCPGLLFADDVAGLMETEEETREFLAGVTKWSQDWQMPMGAQKCGVMLVGGTEEEQKALQRKYFEVDGQKVDAVRKYKYLGIYITDKLGDKDNSDMKAHAETLAEKVKVATNMRRAFLNNKEYPLELKIAVINSKIATVGCYGGEWIGMCQGRTSIIQRQLNVALKIALRSSTKSQLHSTQTMSMELGVPTIEQRMHDMRVRLWQKAPGMKTWLAVLSHPKNRFYCDRNGVKVWTTGTETFLKRILPRWIERERKFAPQIRERESLDERAREIQSENKRYDFKDDPITKENILIPNRQRQESNALVIGRALHKDMYTKVVAATVDYISFGFDRTRKYLHSALYMPQLTEGVLWLTRLRTGAWWTTKRRYYAIDRTGGDNHLSVDVCPCCKGTLRKDEPEYVHILIECSAWNEPRVKYLSETLSFFWSRPRWSQEGRLDSRYNKLEIATRMLGGSILKKDLVPKYRKETPTEMEAEQESPTTLDAYAQGWGGKGEVYIPGLSTHGYVPVAKFLQVVMPQHKLALFPDGKTETDKEAYATTSCEESPVKKRKPWRSEKSSALDRETGNESDNDSEKQNLELTYPLKNLSSALQANAYAGMGTRCIHAELPIKPHALGWDNSDEDTGSERMCEDSCYPRLQTTWTPTGISNQPL